MAVEEIYGLFADSDPDGGLVGAADDATDEDIQAKHKQLAEAAVNAVERGDEARLRKVRLQQPGPETSTLLVLFAQRFSCRYLVGS